MKNSLGDAVRRFVRPTMFFGVSLLLYWFTPDVAQTLGQAFGLELGEATANIALTAVVFTGFSLGFNLIEQLIIRKLVKATTGHAPPRLLIDLLRFMCFIVAGIVVLANIWQKDIAALLTASSVLLAVVGLALRNVIADVFFGIAIAIERPLQIGDWIWVEREMHGRVVEITWRAVRLETTDDETVVIPNSYLSSKPFRNSSAPESYYQDFIEITFDVDLTAANAERILLSAANQVSEVSKQTKPPSVRLVKITGAGVLYQLRFYVPDRASASRVKSDVLKKLARNLHFAGVKVPRDGHEVFVEPLARERVRAKVHIERWVERIDIFKALTNDIHTHLAEQAASHIYFSGQNVVKQHDEGSSLFVLIDGLLDIYIAGPDGIDRKVAEVSPGGVFGEMSLLTGAPRGATVKARIDSRVYEITKDALAVVLAEDHQVVDRMSTMLASRQLANNKALAQASQQEVDKAHADLANQILNKIRNFFGM